MKEKVASKGPIVTVKELNMLIKECGKDEKKLKSFLRQEIGFKKVMHPVDTKERPDLYKMNFLTHEQLLENLTILVDSDLSDADQEEILFPTEDEIIEQILGAANQEVTNAIATEVVIKETIPFAKQQPLTVVSDEDDTRYWCVALFLNENDDETFVVYNLCVKKKSKQREWVRPVSDDVQTILPRFIIPCEVKGEWDYSKRTSTFVVENVEEIEVHFQDFFCDVQIIWFGSVLHLFVFNIFSCLDIQR